MRHRTRPIATAATLVALAVPMLAAASAAQAQTEPTYTAASPSVDAVYGSSTNPAPWNLTQGDLALNGGDLYGSFLPTFNFGGSNPTVSVPAYSNGTTSTPAGTYPNYSVYPGASTNNNLSGSFPYATGYAGDPGPVDGYCSSGGPNPETGTVVNQPAGAQLPMSPYYFPFVMKNPFQPNVLTGIFDYRPKDSDEAMVVANSFDGGKTWEYAGKALELNPGVCADGIQNDNNQGHAYIAEVGGNYYLYTLNRVSGDTLGQGFLVHKLNWTSANALDPLAGLPAMEQVDVGPNPTNPSQGTLGYDPQINDGDNGSAGGPAATTATATVNVPFYNANSGYTDDDGVLEATDNVGATITVGSTANFTNYTGGPGGVIYDLGASANNDAAPGGTTAYSNADDTALPSIHCSANDTVTANTSTSTEFVDCFAFPAPGQSIPTSGYLTVTSADNIVAPPEVPDTAEVTNPASEGQPLSAGTQPGLQAPDGIIGQIPASALPAGDDVPSDATVFLYGEKLLNYWEPATINASSSTSIAVPTSGSGVSIPVSNFGYTGSGAQEYGSLVNNTSPSGAGDDPGTYTVYIGYGKSSSSTNGIAEIQCTGADTAATSVNGSTDELTGCTANSANSIYGNSTATSSAPYGTYNSGLAPSTTSVTIYGGYDVGATQPNQPTEGACIASEQALAATGEGSTNPKTLFKNNEDYTVVRAAYTTDGISFTDLGTASGINDPGYQGNAGDVTPWAKPARTCCTSSARAARSCPTARVATRCSCPVRTARTETLTPSSRSSPRPRPTAPAGAHRCR